MSVWRTLSFVQLVLLAVQIGGSSSEQTAIAARCRRESMQPFLARACNGFGLHVYHSIDHSCNVVLSPVSICTVLAIAMSCARGTTLKELKKQHLLKWTTNTETSNIFRHMFQSFATSEDVNITANNVMFINEHERLVTSTADMFRDFYNGTLKFFNAENREETASTINEYLSSSVEDLVGRRLQGEDIPSNRALFLINTLRLEARWKDMFKNRHTRPMTYHVDSATKILVPMMYRRGAYRWNRSRALKSDAIEIPYEGDRFAMYIILPHDIDGIEMLENKLTAKSNKLRKLISDMDDDTTYTDLYLPKFSIRQTVGLNDVLKKAGIASIFDRETADLSGLLNGTRVYVDKILHKSAIEVTEVGTVAGTFSKISFTYYTSYPLFNANHPFLYVLHDKETEFNLFMGKFTRP